MQSILQSRHFARHLQRQVARHGAATAAGNSALQPEPTMTDTIDVATPIQNCHHTLASEVQNSTESNLNGVRNGSSQDDDLEAAEKVTIEDPQDQVPPRPSSSSSSISSSNPTEVPDVTLGTALGLVLTGVNIRATTSNSEEKRNLFVVGYEGPNDRLNPHNWPKARRYAVMFTVASVGLVVGLAGAIDSAVLPQAKKSFGVSDVTESLATSIFLVGQGSGAFFAGPISESVGRNPVYVITLILFMLFTMASGLSRTIGAQLVCRFWAGFFSTTPLTTASGTMSDIWTAEERTWTFPIYANWTYIGCVIGPLIAGWIGQSSASWRWAEWITLLISSVLLIIIVFFLPETYAPILLTWKAKHLRCITGDDRYVSEVEIRKTSLATRLLHNIYRPFVIFIYEPIVQLFTLYLTVVFIVLFTFLTGYSYIFGDTFGFSQGLTGTAFIGLGIGFCVTTAILPWIHSKYERDLKKALENGQNKLPPEERLYFAMLGGVALPVGLLWMAWTAYSSIGPWSCLVASVFIGFGMLAVFISTYQYLIDSFEAYAASALVMNTFTRYVVSGGMVTVSLPFYNNLGVHWTLTILGCISLLLMPTPFVFYRYGAAIRKKSRYASNLAN